MSSLTLLKRRIRAVETIRKTTHAMRLTSISTHTRLQKQKKLVTHYKETVADLLSSLQRFVSSHHTHITETTGRKTLYIIAGSQKGLCGTFNSQLTQYVRRKFPHIMPYSPEHDTIVLGGKLAEQLRTAGMHITHMYHQFTVTTFVDITHELARSILDTDTYHSVYLIANYSRSFFLQQPEQHQLLPFNPHIREHERDVSEYIWEHEPHEMFDALMRMYVKAHIQELLFQSLLSEQAARFIAMDGATRNADDLLATMRLDYNKIRQAAITRELADLTSGLL